MRRYPMFGALLLIPAMAFFVAAPGCGKNDPKPAPMPAKDTGSEGKKETPAAGGKEALKAGDGVIKGKVTLDGKAPVADKNIALLDHKDCKMAPAGEQVDQSWIVNKDGGVANVVVYLKPGPGKYFEVSDADKKRTETVTIDQPFCAFEPRVIALYPAYYDGKSWSPSGQKFKVLNSAAFPHNTKWSGDPTKNPSGGETIPSKKDLPVDLQPQNTPVTLNCDFHKWMTAKVWVFDHPYAAVTKADGTFEIKGVPTGVEVRVFAWHEVKGNFHGGKEGQPLTPKSGENPLPIKIAP